MSRITAPDRLRRVLAIVPWIMANPGHKVSDVAARFDLTEKALLDDLAVVFMVGLPPYSPDALVEVLIDEDGCVSIDLADYFSRPLRLNPGQALSLLASSEALLSVPGTETDGPLATGLGKLAETLGISTNNERANLEVSLGAAEAGVLTHLRQAASAGESVEISYYSFGRDSMSTRVVSPWRVFSDAGSWYVHAWCTSAAGERIFRLDRIASITASEVPGEPQPDDGGSVTGYFNPQSDDPRVRLKLSADNAWVVEAYPCEEVEYNDDGSLNVVMIITTDVWLYRLLLRLDSGCEILEAPSELDIESGVSRTAAKVLSRYR